MKTILVPLDFSDATDAVVKVARELAEVSKAKIVLTHVLAVMATEVTSFVEDPDSASAQLRELQVMLKADGFDVETSQLHGSPAERIVGEASRVEADFVVIGSHGHGALYDMLVGSTASQILRRAHCPVVIVPRAQQETKM